MPAPLPVRILKRWHKSVDWLRGLYFTYIVLTCHKIFQKPIGDVSTFQRRILFIERHEYSQNGEDGIINAIFKMIGTTNKYYVEFGVEDGTETNTRYLFRRKGWNGLLMDGSNENATINLHKEFITAENIKTLFERYAVPKKFDLLSIDIDGNDYWIWKAIENYHPRVVIVEYNAHIPPEESKTIPYKSDFCWDKTDYYGASLLALKKLSEKKGYTLIGTDRHGVNAFFVLNELIKGNFDPPLWPETYHPPAFKGKKGNRHPSNLQHNPWQEV